MSSRKKKDELRPEYDLATMGPGVVAKYLRKISSGSSVVVLDPDVAKAFPDEESVNRALRLLMDVAVRQTGTARRVVRTARPRVASGGSKSAAIPSKKPAQRGKA